MVFCFRKRKSGRLTACLLRFLSQLQQSTDTSGDRVLGDWRVGETAQLLKGRVGMVESELAGGFKIVRNVVAEDFKGLADLIAGFRGGLGATAHVASSKFARRFALPRASPSERFPVHSRAE